VAGIPGGGVGGLFFLFSAMVMPFVELCRTIRGRSSLGRWRVVGRNAAIAGGMIGALIPTHWALSRVYASTLRNGIGVPVAPLTVTAAVVVAALVATHVLRILIPRSSARPRPKTKGSLTGL
jgi:hypothetical protein